MVRRGRSWWWRLPAVLLAATCCAAAENVPLPLYKEEPFDRITLITAYEGAVLKVLPLEFPNRKAPEHRKPFEKLAVRLFEQPDKLYELEWRSIAKVELFEQMVLEEANARVAAGTLDEAYDFFRDLKERWPKTPGLEQGFDEYLYTDAKAAYARAAYDSALATLRQLAVRSPQRPGLDKPYGAVVEKLVQRYAATGDPTSARRLLALLGETFPEHPVKQHWEATFRGQAEGALTAARAALAADRLPEAARQSRLAGRLWPELPGARELAQTLHERYPRVVVGVTLPAPEDPVPSRLDDWAARRSGRLLYRTLTEFAGTSYEGGRYASPVDELAVENLGRQLAIRVQPGIRWAGVPDALTGYDISQQLLAMADPGSATFSPPWAEWLVAISVRDVYRVDVTLRRAHVRPEALLQVRVRPESSLRQRSSPPPNGPFTVSQRGDAAVVYASRDDYFLRRPGQPREIVERQFATGADTVRALRQGRIDLLDRVYPWHVAQLRGDKRLKVEAYAAPTLHCLIPNLRKPRMADRTFRQALVYGIPREAILRQLLGGADRAGGQVLSGPFPQSSGRDDALGYACDPAVGPRPYDPRLAMTLAAAALRSHARRQADGAAAEGPLVLAYPPDEIAATACASIAARLGAIGIPTTLQRLDGDLPRHVPETVDLLYAELCVNEPLIDARRLLGSDGILGGGSPYLIAALEQLDRAADWGQVRQRLQQVHRLAHEEAAVVPLWQLTEHCACRADFDGLATAPITLYGDVEQWQPAFRYPVDE